MAVTVTTNTLSSRVRYLNVSGSTANADAKDIVLAMADALVDLGWSRYDTAGATSVVGSDDNAGVILRREMHDFAQSGHYNYLGLRLAGTGTTTYTLHVTQAADWTSTTSMTAFVNAAATQRYTPNTTGNTRFMNFAQGGTIWMFDSGKTLLFGSQSGSVLFKDLDSIWIVGEYLKEYGENVNAATGYIHNGVFTNNRWLLDGCGVPSSTAEVTGLLGYVSSGPTTSGGNVRVFGTNGVNDSSVVSNTFHSVRMGMGAGYSQFLLTEAPAIDTTTNNSVTLTRNVGAPASCGIGFSTRLLMGYLGYIGFINHYHFSSINSEFLGSPTTSSYVNGTANNVYKLIAATTSQSTALNTSGFDVNGFSRLFHARGANSYPLLNSVEEFSPTTLPTNLKFTVFEPTLSCGTRNGVSAVTNPTNAYTGPQYKFSMLGRIFDMKIFGPFTEGKYTLLDSITIPCNAQGFYQDGGTDKDFWIIPSGENMAFVMPK
jgi:hypothetical protein